MHNYLITGVAGFIGSELARYLVKSGQIVIGIDDLSFGYEDNYIDLLKSSNFQFVQASILDFDFEEGLKDIDYVLHFAGISSLPECESNPVRAWDVNVSGTLRMLKAIQSSNVKRTLFASTSAIYENNSSLPFHEEDPVSPTLIYSQSKLAAERLCNAFATNYGMDIIAARFFNVFGAHQDFRRPNPPFTSYLVKEMLIGREPIIYNTSGAKRNYIYVSDLIELIMGLLDKPQLSSLVYNLCSNNNYSALEIFEILKDIIGFSGSFAVGNPPDFWSKYPEIFEAKFPLKVERINSEINKVSFGDLSRLISELGYRDFVDMRCGLTKIVEWQNRSE
jgi:UDP-glucose 4-epimerase